MKKLGWSALLNYIAFATWVLLAIPGLTIWKNSVTFVIILSLWANAMAHFSAAKASRAQVEAEKNGGDDA